MIRRESERVPVWAVAMSAAAGATALSYAVLRLLRHRRPGGPRPGALDLLEDAAVDALRRDPQTGSCAIDVAALAPGIIELTGLVPSHEVGQRAARLLHALPGVRTVVNRLDTGTVEERLADNRIRRTRGEPAGTERRWYGMSVGTGRRRQSPDTDPARPDDTVERRTRALEVSSSDVADATNDGAARTDDTHPLQ